MMRSLLTIARAFVGVWNELRKLRTLVEWVLCNGLSGRVGDSPFTIDAIGLPPSDRDVAEAEKEVREHRPVDEEWEAGQRAQEILKARARGEVLDDDPEDWEVY